jgi:predicted permease
VAFGLLPATKMTRRLTEALRVGDRGSSAHARGRGFLVAGEIALAVVVVFLSTLVIRSFERLVRTDPGFRTDHLLSAEMWLPEPRYSDSAPETGWFYQQVLDKIAQSQGVVAASTTTVVPLKPSLVATRFLVDGASPLAPGTYPAAQIRYVSAEFFRTMGLGVRRGRVFEQAEVANGASLFVVNEAFAHQYLSGRDPIGAQILLGLMTPHPQKIPVIGVVANARDLGVASAPEPEIYLPGFGLHAVLLVRTAMDAASAAPVIRGAVESLDARQPVYHVQTMDELLADTMERQRMTATLLGIFAAVALALAAIGIYGVLSYTVAQRTREIGVRMAVGADRGDILVLVARQAGRFTAAGVCVGLAAGLGAARLINHLGTGLLFETSAVDRISMGFAVGALVVVAAAGACLPALRAAAVSPTDALRAE